MVEGRLARSNNGAPLHVDWRAILGHMDEVAAKRRAKVNSKKSRTKTEQLQMRALELFYSLHPTDDNGNPQMWRSANEAMENVLKALEQEAFAQGKMKLDISDRTVLSLCQALHKRDKEGCALDIRVEVIQIMPDGTEITIPLATY